MAVLIYVDDLVLTGSYLSLCASFKQYLHECFYIKDLGPLKCFLGSEVARNSQGLFMCQQKHALDIIDEYGLLGSKPDTSPMEVNHKLAMATKAPLPQATQYRQLTGRLIYLTITHPELSYAVHILSQFMQDPKENHLEAARKVIRCLKGNPGQGILL